MYISPSASENTVTHAGDSSTYRGQQVLLYLQ